MSGPSKSTIFTFQWMQLVLGHIYSITTPGKKKREKAKLFLSLLQEENTLSSLVEESQPRLELLTQDRAVVTLRINREVNISFPSQRFIYLIQRVSNYFNVHFIQVLFRYAVLEESS